MHYQVIHHTPGGLRVRSGRCTFNHDQAYGIECRLLKQKGVYSVKATCNGGVFILYGRNQPQAIFRTLDRLRPETLPQPRTGRARGGQETGPVFSPHSGESFLFLFCKVFAAAPAQNGQKYSGITVPIYGAEWPAWEADGST